MIAGALSGSIASVAWRVEWSDFQCKFVTFFRGAGWALVTLWARFGSRVRVGAGC